MCFIVNKQFIAILISILLMNNIILGQDMTSRQKYWTYGFNLGYFGISPSSKTDISGTTFKNGTSSQIAHDNGRGRYTLDLGSSIGLNTGFLWKDKISKNFTGIQIDFQQNRNSYTFGNPFVNVVRPNSKSDHDEDDLNDSIPKPWIESDLFLKYSIAIERYWVLNRSDRWDSNIDETNGVTYWFIKESFGQTFFHRNNGHQIKLNNSESNIDGNGDIIKSTTTAYNPQSYMIGTEIGLRFMEEKSSLDIGLALYVPISKTYTQQYEFFKNTPSTGINQPNKTESVGKEQITFGGASILLNVNYRFNSKIKSREIDTVKVQKKIRESEQRIVHNTKPHKLFDRKVKVQEKIEVSDSTVIAEIWDKGIVDGDRVSLYLNNVEILHDFTVEKHKKEIVLHLTRGKNYLILHALNLGRIPPNTAAINIGNDNSKKQIILNSNLSKSGALEITYNPDKID